MTTRDTFPSSHSSHSSRSSRSNQGLFTQLTLAGAAALASSAANAQVTVVNVNETIGFGPGNSAGFVSILPGVSQFAISRHTANTFNLHSVGIKVTAGSVTQRASNSYVNTPFGKKFSTLSGPTHHSEPLVSVVSFGTGGHLTGPSPWYLSFRFAPTPGGPFDYGWIELTAANTSSASNTSLTVGEYAFDISGNQLPSGTIPANSTFVPEPSPALALAALSALALGAVGVRRFKALRNYTNAA